FVFNEIGSTFQVGLAGSLRTLVLVGYQVGAIGWILAPLPRGHPSRGGGSRLAQHGVAPHPVAWSEVAWSECDGAVAGRVANPVLVGPIGAQARGPVAPLLFRALVEHPVGGVVVDRHDRAWNRV